VVTSISLILTETSPAAECEPLFHFGVTYFFVFSTAPLLVLGIARNSPLDSLVVGIPTICMVLNTGVRLASAYKKLRVQDHDWLGDRWPLYVFVFGVEAVCELWYLLWRVDVRFWIDSPKDRALRAKSTAAV
jgi:hypothetical protein